MYDACTCSIVIPIKRDGNCLFPAVSLYMCNIKDRHSEIRLNTVNKTVYEWKDSIDFTVDLSTVNNA